MKFDVGQLVWTWTGRFEPSTALVVEVLEGGYYNLLIEEQIYKLPDNWIWTKKEDCVQPMSIPSGLIFYMDYAYGSGSKDKE